LKLTAINRIDGGERNEQTQVGLRAVYAVAAKKHGRQDRHGVLPAVDEVGKHVLGVVVTSDTLQSTPYRWKGAEEAHQL